jgi:colicin import membrane protein
MARLLLTTGHLDSVKVEALKATLAEAYGVAPEDVLHLPAGTSAVLLKDAPSFAEVEKRKAEEKAKAEKEAAKEAEKAAREAEKTEKAAAEKAAAEKAAAAKTAHHPATTTPTKV